MSFDLAILSGANPLEPDAAENAYHRLAAGEAWEGVLAPDPRITDLVKVITRRWPQPDDLPEEELDDCPWVSSFEVTPASVLVGIRWDRVSDVPRAVIDMAMKSGLYVIDPQEGLLHSPGGIPRALTARPRETRVCAACGKAIPAGEPWIEQPGTSDIFHVACILGRGAGPGN